MNHQTTFVYDKTIKNPAVKSILNIGFRYDSDTSILSYALSNGKTFTALEVYAPNVDSMRKFGIDCVLMDVRDIQRLERNYDAIVWLHGPEHITWEDFLACREKIEAKSNVITLYQAPIGECPQEDIYGNPYERHVQTLCPKMFEELGYNIFDHSPFNEKTFSAWVEK